MKRAIQPALTLELHDTPRGLVGRLSGDAGVASADELQRLLLPLSARRPALLVLDLADLVFISSLTMGILVAFQRGLKPHQSQLVLAAVPAIIQQAFRHAMLESMFRFVDSVDDALNASSVNLEGREA
jgi:anti-anti-sigma factor